MIDLDEFFKSDRLEGPGSTFKAYSPSGTFGPRDVDPDPNSWSVGRSGALPPESFEIERSADAG